MEKKIVILSGELMERGDIGVFVIDPSTITTHKPRLIVDYNHDEAEIIGYVENIRVEEGKLIGDMTLESATPNDRAAEVIARIESGTPYEFSPTVMLDETGVVQETATTDDGMEYIVYRNVPLRGVSICPFGTDKCTTILSLYGGQEMRKVKRIKSKKLNRKPTKLTKMAADEILDEALVESTVVDEAVGEGEGEGGGEVVTYDAYPLLEEFIAEFGFDLGVEYYRRGYDIDQAREADYAQLKAARLAAEEIDEAGAIEEVEQIDDAVPEAIAEEVLVEDAQEAVDEAVDETAEEDKITLKQAKTTLKANIVLAKQVRALARELTKLKAVSMRGTDAVKSTGRKAIPMDAVHRFARKVKNR